MLNQEIAIKAAAMPTPELASWVGKLVQQKRDLKGKTAGNIYSQQRNNEIKRYLVIIEPELKNRQLRMKGF